MLLSFINGLLIGIIALATGIAGFRRRRRSFIRSQAAQCILQIEKAAQHFHQTPSAISEDIRQRQQMVKPELLRQFRRWASLHPEVTSSAVAALVESLTEANIQLTVNLLETKQELASGLKQIESCLSAAHTDTLTGLPNRRAFDEQLDRRFGEWKHTGMPFCLLIFDIDHFKQFNDRYGHLAGDAVLASISSALGGTVRACDMLARYGGEEFIMIMPATIGRGGCVVAQRIIQAIAENRLFHEGTNLEVTISCGVAEVQSGDDARSLVERADSAMYASKEAGRNCGHIHDRGSHHYIPSDGVLDGQDQSLFDSRANASNDSASELAQLCQELQVRLLEFANEEAAL